MSIGRSRDKQEGVRDAREATRPRPLEGDRVLIDADVPGATAHSSPWKVHQLFDSGDRRVACLVPDRQCDDQRAPAGRSTNTPTDAGAGSITIEIDRVTVVDRCAPPLLSQPAGLLLKYILVSALITAFLPLVLWLGTFGSGNSDQDVDYVLVLRPALAVALQGTLAVLVIAVNVAVWSWAPHDDRRSPEWMPLTRAGTATLAIASLSVGFMTLLQDFPTSMHLTLGLLCVAVGLVTAALAIDSDQRLDALDETLDQREQAEQRRRRVLSHACARWRAAERSPRPKHPLLHPPKGTWPFLIACWAGSAAAVVAVNLGDLDGSTWRRCLAIGVLQTALTGLLAYFLLEIICNAATRSIVEPVLYSLIILLTMTIWTLSLLVSAGDWWGVGQSVMLAVAVFGPTVWLGVTALKRPTTSLLAPYVYDALAKQLRRMEATTARPTRTRHRLPRWANLRSWVDDVSGFGPPAVAADEHDAPSAARGSGP